MNDIPPLARVSAVEPLEGFRLRLAFTYGLIRDVDLSRDLWGPMAEPLQDPATSARCGLIPNSAQSYGLTATTSIHACSTATHEPAVGLPHRHRVSGRESRTHHQRWPSTGRRRSLRVVGLASFGLRRRHLPLSDRAS
jgi:hypothetical protein